MTTSRAIIGVDPGLGGAVAVLTTPSNTIIVRDTPTYEIGGKRRIDLHGFDRILGELVLIYEPSLAVVEDVHAMPKQGVTSSFIFGRVLGNVEALIAARKIPIRYVSPAAWKRMLGLGRDKDESRRLASRLFPHAASMWPLKKHDGRAESVLLAHYGARLV